MLVKPKVSNTTLTPADVKQQVATNDEYDDTFTIDELNDYKKATYAKKQQENDAQNKAQKRVKQIVIQTAIVQALKRLFIEQS
jgi:hypothetical protein